MEEINKKFNSILDTIFWEKWSKNTGNTEIVIKPWHYFYYISNWKWKNYNLKFDFSNDEIFEFQDFIIKNKFIDDTSSYDDFYNSFKENWHVNYSFIYNWMPLRINWSIWMWENFMRIRKLPSKMYSPEEIWVPRVILEEIKKYRSWWLIVVSAPPGSGKSTTIASVLQSMLNWEDIINMVTLEDPIEYVYSKETPSIIQQREKIFDFKDFSTWVEACMRQTPNIVVVQEMTNKDIVRQVMELADKWVLVITTLHTADTTSVFESILWAYDSSRRKEILNKLSSVFNCFISQKLIPKKDWKWKVAVFEVLTNTNESKWYILDDATKNLHQIMNKEPHLLISDSILQKIEEGVISIKDGLSYCPYSRKDILEDSLWVRETDLQ